MAKVYCRQLWRVRPSRTLPLNVGGALAVSCRRGSVQFMGPPGFRSASSSAPPKMMRLDSGDDEASPDSCPQGAAM